MARTAKLLLVLAVLAGSAAAFAVSEGLKVQRAAVTAVHVDKIFSPACDCEQAHAAIAFKLTRTDRVSVAVLGGDGAVVRHLVRSRLFNRGPHHFTWNGRDDRGRLVPEGSYLPRVRLERTAKTFVLPNPIELDVTPPRIHVVSVKPRVISPDGDGRSDVTRVRYRVNERAHGLLYVGGRLEVRTKFQRLHDNLNWYGRVGGGVLPPGRYRLSVAAVDRAGNESRRVPAGFVQIRFVSLPQGVVQTTQRAPLAIPVSADAKTVRYVLRRGASTVASGTARRVVRFRAPKKPGRYVLTAAVGDHRDRAVVVVRKR